MTHLILLRGLEGIDDAMDRTRGIAGVQRREHEVARFGRSERGADRLGVADLADEDHVRILSQHLTHRVGEARCVLADLRWCTSDMR